jgi:hypothetical protein
MMYKKPTAVSWPIWKFVLLVLLLQAIFTFLAWLDRSFFNNALPTVVDILAGSGVSIFALWQRWVWKRFNGVRLRLLVWIGNVFVSFYLSGLLLVGAMRKWSLLAGEPWSWFVNGSLLIAFVGMWLLPLFSFTSAKRIHKFQWKISGFAVGLSGIAGILGALFGMFSSRHGEKGAVIFVLGILLSLLSIGFAQHAGYESWINRPYAKENANAKS